eukprot:1836884-Alexandrium_andersonii.AAC.1
MADSPRGRRRRLIRAPTEPPPNWRSTAGEEAFTKHFRSGTPSRPAVRGPHGPLWRESARAHAASRA